MSISQKMRVRKIGMVENCAKSWRDLTQEGAPAVMKCTTTQRPLALPSKRFHSSALPTVTTRTCAAFRRALRMESGGAHVACAIVSSHFISARATTLPAQLTRPYDAAASVPWSEMETVGGLKLCQAGGSRSVLDLDGLPYGCGPAKSALAIDEIRLRFDCAWTARMPLTPTSGQPMSPKSRLRT